jgi:glycosyltransferase involved in cell wall biosynthesis
MMKNAARPLVVVHYHWRPGGVRRVIETALPALVRTGCFNRVMLAAGEAPEESWLNALRKALAPRSVEVAVFEALGYGAGRGGGRVRSAAVREAGRRLLAGAGADAVVWLHNPALGRHAGLATALAHAAADHEAVILFHHHDFLFDNRWGHWAGIEADGFADLRSVAEAFFPASPRAAHLCLNAGDHALVERGFASRAVLLRNPVARPAVRPGERAAASRWLEAKCGASPAGYWLVPCRLLRRKNLAESVLLSRWLAPGTAVVTTGGPSSADEQAYADRLTAVAQRDGWPFHPAVLDSVARAPSVEALMAASAAVVSTSLREGFGLTVYEAAALRRPVLARATGDLAVSAPEGAVVYDDVQVPRDLFDWRSEAARRAALWKEWRNKLPSEAAALAGPPGRPGEDRADVWTFSRLTLPAQTEVLGRSAEDLAAALDGLNPLLAAWRRMELRQARWTETGAGPSDLERFAGEFLAAIDRAEHAPPPEATASSRVLAGFLRERLAGANFYPLLAGDGT